MFRPPPRVELGVVGGPERAREPSVLGRSQTQLVPDPLIRGELVRFAIRELRSEGRSGRSGPISRSERERTLPGWEVLGRARAPLREFDNIATRCCEVRVSVTALKSYPGLEPLGPGTWRVCTARVRDLRE